MMIFPMCLWIKIVLDIINVVYQQVRDYALYDDYPKRSLVERVVWTRSRLD